ncbi:putative Amino acid permease [Seiridium cardinale]|uniref:Amino acid permease n=1 Tax=Seiridium cardinale TaxID=138064 RepID=A0ABR2Y8W4_9PEZI
MHEPTGPPAIEAVGDIEKNGHVADGDKDVLVPQLNVGGHGATQRRLRDYQVTMIGFCSGIGTGLFIGTGAAYAKSGPAGLLLAYTIVGAVLWCVMQSIAELATLIPTAGSFPHWATRFIDPAVGFSLAISYGYCYTIAIASECSAAAILVSYWTDISPAVVISVSLALILIINLLSVRFFGETEVVTGAIKVACFIGLVIASIVITAGGGPTHDHIGFRYWHNPGAWVNYNGITGSTGHFLGFLSAFVNASFSFIGVETVVITAAESINPHRAIPKAASRVTYRIGFFYVLGALLIGLIVDPRNEDLISGTGNANSSPWVIAIKEAGINVLPSIVNACILISAWSAGSSYCWVGSRMIVAMTTDRQLPQIFGRTTRNGVPWVAVIVAWLFGPLAYLSLGTGGASQAFSWLLNLSTVAGLIAWATLCACYIRFHRAMKVQGVDRKSLPWRSPFQPYTAWVGFIGSSIITLITGFPVFLDGNWVTADFIASYIGIPIFIIPIIAWKLFKKSKFVRAKDISHRSHHIDREEAIAMTFSVHPAANSPEIDIPLFNATSVLFPSPNYRYLLEHPPAKALWPPSITAPVYWS